MRSIQLLHCLPLAHFLHVCRGDAATPGQPVLSTTLDLGGLHANRSGFSMPSWRMWRAGVGTVQALAVAQCNRVR